MSSEQPELSSYLQDMQRSGSMTLELLTNSLVSLVERVSVMEETLDLLSVNTSSEMT